ncbi:NUMOD4 domain-containing protein [Bradyrhizobium sp. HKCCYLS2038]|uniref:NUMOD4 domain-containing protein n=1 Tax=Bradyrhizobium sp. HKCCYLS2038 TaxID=3420764 RepID=UPI003EBDEF86
MVDFIPGEQWRQITGHDGYFISSRGRVCTIDRTVMRSNGSPQFCRGRVLRQKVKKSGHLVVTLGLRQIEYVHTLVLTAFVCPRPPGLEALHEDDNPANNLYHNLRWGTRSQNLNDAIGNGKKPVGEQNWNAKLTEDAVRFIRSNSHLSLTELANRFGVHRQTIAKIRDFRMWRYVQ